MNYNRGVDAHVVAASRISDLEEALRAKDSIIAALQEELNKKVQNDQTTFRPRAPRASES
jgi:hypothetical protein